MACSCSFVLTCTVKKKHDYERETVHLSGSDFDGERIPLVRELDDLRPHEAVDSQTVLIEQQADRRHAHLHRLITTVLQHQQQLQTSTTRDPCQ